MLALRSHVLEALGGTLIQVVLHSRKVELARRHSDFRLSRLSLPSPLGTIGACVQLSMQLWATPTSRSFDRRDAAAVCGYGCAARGLLGDWGWGSAKAATRSAARSVRAPSAPVPRRPAARAPVPRAPPQAPPWVRAASAAPAPPYAGQVGDGVRCVRCPRAPKTSCIHPGCYKCPVPTPMPAVPVGRPRWAAPRG